MNIDDLFDNPERNRFHYAKTLGYMLCFAIYCLSIIGTGSPSFAILLVWVIVPSYYFLREMRLNVARNPNIVFYERKVWSFEINLLTLFFVGLAIITHPIMRIQDFSHKITFSLVIGILYAYLWSRLMQDFCIHHSGIYINKQFYPWRYVVGVSWEGVDDNVLVMDLKRETDSLPDIQKYRWAIPTEQKEKIKAILTLWRPA